MNRIEAQFAALRHFTLDGTDHGSHKEQASMIRRYIIWRNRHAENEAPRRSWPGTRRLEDMPEPDEHQLGKRRKRYWRRH